MYFLAIPFSYSAANIRPNDMIAGMPAMSAISGMAHNVERLLRDQLEVPSLTGAAFSLVYFNLDRDIASPRRPPEKLGGGSDMILPALVDIRRAHGEAMLVVNFDISNQDEMDRFARLSSGQEGLARIESILNARLRFAGGEIFLGLAGEFGNSALNVGLHQAWGDVISLMLKAYPTQGLLIQDMSHLVTSAALERGVSTLDAMVELVYQSKLALKSNSIKASAAGIAPPASVGEAGDEPALSGSDTDTTIGPDTELDDLDDLELLDMGDEDLAADESDVTTLEASDSSSTYMGVLIPCAVGFHEVCAGHAGDGSYPHVYVESVLSLVRARSVPSVKRDISQAREPWQAHFWRWEHLPHHRLYRAVSFSK